MITGRGLVRGRPVAVIANEFRFLAGSIGRDAAGRITAAVRRATAEGLPLLATTASGGTRMQEGTPAFVEMVEITPSDRRTTAPPGFPTSSTCGTPPPVGCTRRGVRSGTSPSPNQAHSWASSARRSSRR